MVVFGLHGHPHREGSGRVRPFPETAGCGVERVCGPSARCFEVIQHDGCEVADGNESWFFNLHRTVESVDRQTNCEYAVALIRVRWVRLRARRPIPELPEHA